MQIKVSHKLDGIEEYDVEKFYKSEKELISIIKKSIKSGVSPQVGNRLITNDDGNIYEITSILFGNYIFYDLIDVNWNTQEL